jgi:hypothetical protein
MLALVIAELRLRLRGAVEVPQVLERAAGLAGGLNGHGASFQGMRE